MLLILTHDVDWSRRGPPTEHVIARLDRFDWSYRYRFFSLRENIYDGIADIVEAEQRQGVRSTFFFRTLYDDNTTAELYSDVISELRRGGWEIGLHANSGSSLREIEAEKKMLEKLYANSIYSLRVHYLRIDREIIPRLSTIGIKFDSSLCTSRTKLDLQSSGCIIYGGVVELPITLMDAYMFTYWGVRPEETYRKLVDVLKYLKSVGVEVATILWHVNSIKMRGGREYIRFIEDIWRLEWLTPLRVVDIAMFVGKGKVLCKVYE
jgi:peptidoglycan/xylan/chitin deacetylase (PgdA/CDA1 family)